VQRDNVELGVKDPGEGTLKVMVSPLASWWVLSTTKNVSVAEADTVLGSVVIPTFFIEVCPATSVDRSHTRDEAYKH